ncbi:MAG: hypothetical protein H6573_22365 [Lewinellaceae bacterium]|nr:hypothetical protein [Lewinellaceae bacterium]
MYQYAYRIKDRYGKLAVALAIFTDANRQHHYSEYQESFWGTRIHYQFHTFILMDHEPHALRRSRNLFSLVVEVAHQELSLKNKGDDHRLDIKMKLVRRLLQLKIERRKIRKLLNFIKFYISFDEDDFFHKFEKNIQQLTKSREAMGIEEAILQEFKERGLKEGREEGRKQGREEGLEQGLEKGREESIRLVVSRAWKKDMPVEMIADLVGLPVEKVEAIILELTDKE